MRFSILHISDLHQNLKDEIPPDVLLDTLESDFKRFVSSEPIIPLPDICVVSGDIVYGVSPSVPDPGAELQRQYDQAHEFLVRLCERFFAGKRERVVIIPGNHDVDYSEVIRSGSFLKVPRGAADKTALVAELFSPNSNLRWSWPRLEFFRVADQVVYNNRLWQFATLYERFYKGARTYSLDPPNQLDVFDFPEFSFCLAALSSCHRNDPMNRVGAIHPSALIEACRELKSPSRAGWCLGASWHHDISGGAGHEDFLDAGFVQHLIDAGVTLGFHGHRHRRDCFDQRSKLGDVPRKMTVIAAGTLCAGPTNLSPGIPRGYNVVQIDTDALTGRVHSRQMVNELQSVPIWGPGHFFETNKSYLDFELSPPERSRPASLDKELTIERAADLYGEQKWREVVDLLTDIADDQRARRFFLGALQELADDRLTMQRLPEPRDATEAVILGGALLEAGSTSEIRDFLAVNIVRTGRDASLDEVKKRLNRKISK